MVNESISHVFERLQAGDSASAAELWRYYFPRMLDLAKRTIGDGLPKQIDAEGVVQSAFLSFWSRIQKKSIAGPMDREDLWSLLAALTDQKCQMHLRLEQGSQGGADDAPSQSMPRSDVGDGPQQFEKLIGDASAHDFDLWCEELLNQLGPELRRFTMLRLVGFQDTDIAAQIGVSESTVNRKLRIAGKIWAKELDLTR